MFFYSIRVLLSGNTTDVIALKVLPDGKLEEICKGVGEPIGGQNINDAFFNACTDAFKRNDWTKLSANSNAVELLEMENDFEGKKVVIGTDEEIDEHIKLKMPDAFQSLLTEGEIQLKGTHDIGHRFRIDGKRFMFNSEFIRESLFNETIGMILKALGHILSDNEVNAVKNVVLVGGFSESPIVVQKIKAFVDEHFPGKEIVVPTSPFTAVMSGAVLYGHDPLIFNSRISRATYGVRICTPFNPDIHREDKKRKDEETGKDMCDDIFDIHVRKGCSVKLEHKQPSKVYAPMYKDTKVVRIAIYKSSADSICDPAYVTDAQCRKIGEFDVKIPDTSGGRARRFTVTMVYGGTELAVLAKDEKTGEEKEALFRFDAS